MDVDINGAKKLFLVVTDGGDGYTFDWSDWVEPKLIRADGSALDLTQMKWKSGTTGYGNIGVNVNLQGNPLMIGTRKFSTGFGVHAPSMLEFELPENVVRFTAKAGLDAGGTAQGTPSVEFYVFTETPPANIFDAVPAAASASGETVGPEAAREAIKLMTIAEGFEVTLFASEPMLRNPSNIDIDARGRIWVAEAVNYRSSFKPWGTLDPKGDRIVILEDTNGDGLADSNKTFYQGTDIDAALGVCVLGNRVIVSRSPHVFILTDTDGDDKADKKEVLFSGIGAVDHDHGVHAFTFGPDGKLYFDMGNDSGELKRPDGTTVIDIDGAKVLPREGSYRQGMAFRCKMDGTEVESLAHNFRNPYECAVDSFGTVWQSDNDDDGNRAVRINYVMEGGNYGFADEMTGAGWGQKRTNFETEIPQRHWHLNDPGVVPNLLITGSGAPTGIAIYEGKLLPEVFRNQMIHCDAGPRVVRSYPVEPDGAGYRAKTVDIVSSSDSWFRPSDVVVAPDGSLYFSDWNDAGVGGHNMVDHKVADMRGRVYRVAPRGHKASIPKHDYTTASGCAEALCSPNHAIRYLAWTKLHGMQGKAERDLLKLWKSSEDRWRARALHLLARIKGQEQKYVSLGLKDKNADIRITALRIARDLKLPVLPMVQKLASDTSLHVRRECVLALRRETSPEAADMWAQLALKHDGQDRWYLEALGIAARNKEKTCFEAWVKRAGDKWNTPAGRDIIWRSRAPQAANYLAKIIADPGTPETERARYFRAFDFLQGPEKNAALVSLLDAVAR